MSDRESHGSDSAGRLRGADYTLTVPDHLKTLADRIIDLRRHSVVTPAYMAKLLERIWWDKERLEREVSSLEAPVE